MKIRIPKWHGESWVYDPGAGTAQAAAERAVDRYISEAAAYDIVGGDPVRVEVDDEMVTEWDVSVEATWQCYAQRARK